MIDVCDDAEIPDVGCIHRYPALRDDPFRRLRDMLLMAAIMDTARHSARRFIRAPAAVRERAISIPDSDYPDYARGGSGILSILQGVEKKG